MANTGESLKNSDLNRHRAENAKISELNQLEEIWCFACIRIKIKVSLHRRILKTEAVWHYPRQLRKYKTILRR